jgi:nicotinamidase-related amidase
MKTCLIVIDAQESFRHRPYFSENDMPAYLAAQNALVEGCLHKNISIVRVFHVDGPDVASNAFAIKSGHVKPLAGLIEFAADATFHKNRHSALVGSGLEVWLNQNQIGKIIVSGIRTEQCCETTTRHASDLGYAIDYALDATMTWDMQQPDGKTLSVADIRMRTATVLQDRFATVCNTQSALDRINSYE